MKASSSPRACSRDSFALAFELFINVGHVFVASAGIPEAFATSPGRRPSPTSAAKPARTPGRAATSPPRNHPKIAPTKKPAVEFLESAFADAVAIYQLSLAVDFDYSELREREYPLLAPAALADRLRLIANLFPPNPGYEFAIRYRRRP